MSHNEIMSPIQSVLKIDPVVFDELSFQRMGFENKNADIQTNLGVTKQVNKISDGHYRVTVQAIATREDEYVAKVQISGFCSIDEGLDNKEVLLNQNAVAILFAYVRSQLTLLTAQPGTTPIVLPVMNIAKMISTSEEQGED